MQENAYLMENADEIMRLEIKTGRDAIERQSGWAGIKPGMRVADIGCGAGITSVILHELVSPHGTVVGVDSSPTRIEHARRCYGNRGLEFKCCDILSPLTDLGEFDFIWVRFLLEYYRSESFEIVRNLNGILKPGGILCLIDLDHNSLNHYGMSQRLEQTISTAMKTLEETANFDPYIGRKLYSFLYDLGYMDIDVMVEAHHLIFGELREADAFNWMKKIEVISRKIDYRFEDKSWGIEEFISEFREFFSNPRRFTYSPLVSCRGRKP